MGGSIPLIKSLIRAYHDEFWVNFFGYIIAYLLCLFVTFFRSVPLKIRAWIIICGLFGLATLSMFSLGPIGSGRLWLFTCTVIATLTLGIRAGVVALVAQLIVLTISGVHIHSGATSWLSLQYSIDVWVTTSITFVFISSITVIALGILIRGLADALEWSRQTEERWHFALEGAGDGVWDWDLVQDSVYYSPRWRTMLGYGQDEELATTMYVAYARMHPEDREEVVRAIERCVCGERTTFRKRYRIRRKNGSYMWVLDRGKIMERDQAGKPLRMIGTLADISVLKKLEEKQIAYEARLQQAQKMEAIGTLAGGVAHDFNNILTPIIGYTELLLNDSPPSGLQRENLNEIYAASMRARDLVRQILAFSRQDVVEARPIQMEIIVKEALKLLRASIPATVEITSRIEKDCGLINASPTEVHQVVMNLCTNAFHAMEDQGGQMFVGLERKDVERNEMVEVGVEPGRYVVLTVSDTGMGIPEEMICKIFDPFFTTKEQGKGTGLGLSQVHGVVQRLGGVVEVDSKPGKGSTFKVYLPVTSEEKNADLKSPSGILGGNEHVLLVDDEAQIITLRVRQLEMLGYRVSAYKDSMEALDAFREDPDKYDIIIADQAMPNLSGDNLIEAIRSIRPEVPVLMCTGLHTSISKERRDELGIDSFLLKPVSMPDLANEIRLVLASNN